MEGWILMSNKRLYRASQGAMISGVCQGIADYFKMDATIIRLIWVVVTIFSFGFAGVVLYIA
ncbi:MAG: PspC domain-containing protein, partial [Turicibacter sp.]